MILPSSAFRDTIVPSSIFLPGYTQFARSSALRHQLLHDGMMTIQTLTSPCKYLTLFVDEESRRTAEGLGLREESGVIFEGESSSVGTRTYGNTGLETGFLGREDGLEDERPIVSVRV